MRYFVRRFLVLLLAYAALGIVVTVLQSAALLFYDPQNTAWMRMRVREAKHEDKTLEIKHEFVSLSEIPVNMQRAVVAAEDDGFYEHHGFDFDALRKAMERNEKSGKVKRGGSTITQQLAKNLFLSPSRSYVRKIREAMITVCLETFLTKERILELYLNSIEFGPGVFGIEAAAEYHYHTHARNLSLDQSCRLAAIIPSPRRYRVNGDYVSRRAGALRRIIGGPERREPFVPDSTVRLELDSLLLAEPDPTEVDPKSP